MSRGCVCQFVVIGGLFVLLRWLALLGMMLASYRSRLIMGFHFLCCLPVLGVQYHSSFAYDLFSALNTVLLRSSFHHSLSTPHGVLLVPSCLDHTILYCMLCSFTFGYDPLRFTPALFSAAHWPCPESRIDRSELRPLISQRRNILRLFGHDEPGLGRLSARTILPDQPRGRPSEI